jgi:hypothetical protein
VVFMIYSSLFLAFGHNSSSLRRRLCSYVYKNCACLAVVKTRAHCWGGKFCSKYYPSYCIVCTYTYLLLVFTSGYLTHWKIWIGVISYLPLDVVRRGRRRSPSVVSVVWLVGWGKVLSQTQPERCARYWKQDFGKYKEFIKK